MPPVPELLVGDSTTLPAWVAWIAQDADGQWWGYECEPNRHDSGWYENEIGRQVCLQRGAANPHWEGSLRRVTES